MKVLLAFSFVALFSLGASAEYTWKCKIYDHGGSPMIGTTTVLAPTKGKAVQKCFDQQRRDCRCTKIKSKK